MNQEEIIILIAKFEIIARRLTCKWGMPYEWEEIYSEMCCAFARKNGHLKDKPMAYTVRVCRNEAINKYFRGKSICSKPRRGLRIVDYEKLSECIPAQRSLEQDLRNKILVNKILKVLTEREKQVAEMIMEGYTEEEMAKNLGISQPRVNYLKKRMRKKAKRLLSRGL